MDYEGKSLFRTSKGMPMPLGATVTGNGINFAVSLANANECRLNFYSINTGELVDSIQLTRKNKYGNVFSIFVNLDKAPGLSQKQKNRYPMEDLAYTYSCGGKEFVDPYAKVIHGREIYGRLLYSEEKRCIRGGFPWAEFDWQKDVTLELPYSSLIIYKMNIRGFTKHQSSGVKNKGTFRGVMEKIPYLKELGINCIQVMPVYEFNEIIEHSPRNDFRTAGSNHRINYWGYSRENLYFAPKASYSSDVSHADDELKSLIKELHCNGIEFLMEMYFPYGTNLGLVQDCLRYWTMEYHVDGFMLTGEGVPAALLAGDPILGKVKLLSGHWDTEYIYGRDFIPDFKNLAEYNDLYSTSVKRFLRGDESQVKPIAEGLKYNPGKCGVINYISNQDGFTLMDLVSYDIKHNDANGEHNSDGMEYNYSWNCGEEGKTKKEKVIRLRKKQIRNAFTSLFFSQGTPMIYAGDEFGNSQNGNNNAYCQDNEISWLIWEDLKANQDIFQFVKNLIAFRKLHPILHMEQPLKNMDYISCGFPDLSFHGTRAWYPDYSYYSRMLGVMLSGRYVKINRFENDYNFYMIFNMHWENHKFDLPNLPKGMKWHLILNTQDTSGLENSEVLPIEDQRQYEVPSRTIVILIGKE